MAAETEFDVTARVTCTREAAEALASAITTDNAELHPSVLVQQVVDTPETPDNTTLLVPSDALNAVREHTTAMAESDPYSEEYELALARLIPALHRLLGISAESTPERVAAAPAEPQTVNW